jgi:hypothetical protein
MIFPQDPNAKWPYRRNIGTGPDGKLTYAEFMARLEKKDPRNADNIIKTMVAPAETTGGKPTIHECAQELMNAGYNKQLQPSEVDTSLMGKNFEVGGNAYNANDPHNDPYNELIGRADRKFQEYRKKIDTNFMNSKNKVATSLLEAITTLRVEDTSSWLYHQMQQDSGKQGLGLAEEDIVVQKNRASGVPNGPKYNKVDVIETLLNGWVNDGFRAKLKSAGIASFGDFLTWADNLGDPDKRASLDYTDLNKTHFRALKTWRMAYSKSKLTLSALKSC